MSVLVGGGRFFAGLLPAHLRAVPHHFLVAHAAMLGAIMFRGVVTALCLMLLHHLAMAHHLFMAHGLMLHALSRSATT